MAKKGLTTLFFHYCFFDFQKKKKRIINLVFIAQKQYDFLTENLISLILSHYRIIKPEKNLNKFHKKMCFEIKMYSTIFSFLANCFYFFVFFDGFVDLFMYFCCD